MAQQSDIVIQNTDGASNKVELTLYKDSPDLRTAALVADSGVLALFPSSLSHYVPINTSDEARISLSFNTFAKDFLGNKDSLTYVDFRKD